MSFCTAVSLLLLQVFAGIWVSTHAYPGVIRHGPETRVTETGTTACFTCHAIGTSSWVINGTVTTPQAYGRYERKGFSFSRAILHSHDDYIELNLTLSISVSLEINDTSIACQAIGSDADQVARSQTAKLIIGTPPLPPAPEVLLINATALQLSWEPPFTWSEYPLLNYTIRMHNTSSGEQFAWVHTIPATVTTYVVFSCGRMIFSSYHELVFSVMASNDLGESSQGTVHSGFPVVPGEFNTSLITYEVSLQQSDGSLLLKLIFESPQVCPSAWYRITVTGNTGGRIISEVVNSLTSGAMVHEKITSNLSLNQNYSLSLVAETLAGSNTPFTFHFNTVFCHSTTTTAATTNTTIITTAHTANDGETKDSVMIISAVLLGASMVLCILMAVILGAIFFYRKHKGHNTTDEKPPKSIPPMVVCTIYDDPLNDSIDTKQPKLQVEGPQYDDIPPRLPPSRKSSKWGSEREIGKMAVSFRNDLIPPSGDEYTIMKPVSVGMMPKIQRKKSATPMDSENDYVIINS